MARILRAPAALSDAVEIWSYIAQDNPDAADRLLDRIDGMVQMIAAQPELGTGWRNSRLISALFLSATI